MVVIIIIVLIIGIFWYRSEAQDTKEQLLKEKSKIENFQFLVTLLKNSESGFSLFTYRDNRILKKDMGYGKYKMYTINSVNGRIDVSVFFNGRNREIKHFEFSIYDNFQDICDTVTSGTFAFEQKILKEKPDFWKF